ncbi:MAG: hypothetical protein AAFU79_37100, partial [Myxococcota bacterium]
MTEKDAVTGGLDHTVGAVSDPFAIIEHREARLVALERDTLAKLSVRLEDQHLGRLEPRDEDRLVGHDHIPEVFGQSRAHLLVTGRGVETKKGTVETSNPQSTFGVVEASRRGTRREAPSDAPVHGPVGAFVLDDCNRASATKH